MARSAEAAREETAAATHRHAQASVPPVEQGRGTTRATKAPQTPARQVVEGENVIPGFKDKTECITIYICQDQVSYI